MIKLGDAKMTRIMVGMVVALLLITSVAALVSAQVRKPDLRGEIINVTFDIKESAEVARSFSEDESELSLNFGKFVDGDVTCYVHMIHQTFSCVKTQ